MCLYNLNLPFSVTPGTLEADVIDAGQRAPLLIFNLNIANTTGVCIPAAKDQVQTITRNLQVGFTSRWINVDWNTFTKCSQLAIKGNTTGLCIPAAKDQVD